MDCVGNYRKTRNYENLERRIFNGVGSYGIPPLLPVEYQGGCEFIGFNYAVKCKNRHEKGLHPEKIIFTAMCPPSAGRIS